MNMASRIWKSAYERRTALAWVALGVAVFCAVVYAIGSDDSRSLAQEVNEQTWIDLDGLAFAHTLKPFDDTPVTGPTGKPAFRAELCYWTRDGKVKETPTPVLLNKYRNLPEPTYCPDCGRLVVLLNPPPLLDVPDDQQRRAPPRREDEAE
jgi:hypothetical protein